MHALCTGSEVRGVRDSAFGIRIVSTPRATVSQDPGEVASRLLYAKNARNEAGALRVLATHVLDMKASQAFFGNPTRLQRDILADATKNHIPHMQLP